MKPSGFSTLCPISYTRFHIYRYRTQMMRLADILQKTVANLTVNVSFTFHEDHLLFDLVIAYPSIEISIKPMKYHNHLYTNESWML